jgi:leader peptidase (prepilin peptidase)/N-methyltransferase
MRIAVAGVVLAWLAVLSLYDVRQRRLPNVLTLPGAGIILVAGMMGGRGSAALAGAAALCAVYLVVHLAVPAAMGAGDVKLAIGLGALTGCFGVDVWFLAALGAQLLTSAVSVVASLRRSAHAVPHGPSMCVASTAAIALALI